MNHFRFFYFSLLVKYSLQVNSIILTETQNETQYLKPDYTKFEVYQLFSNFTCVYQVNYDDLGNFLLFQLNINDPVLDHQAKFSLKVPNKRTLVDNKIESEITDENGFYLMKKHLFLILDPKLVEQSDEVLLNINIPENIYYQYNLSITREQIKPCPQECFHNGNCIQSSCSCSKEYGDEDCSQKVTEIKDITNITLYNQERYIAYFEPMSQQTPQITLAISVIEGLLQTQKISLYVKNEVRKGVRLPTKDIHDKYSSLNQLNEQFFLKIDPNQLEYYEDFHRTQRVYIAIETTYFINTTVQISIVQNEESGGDGISMLLVYILVSIAVVLIITWIILTIVKIRTSRMNQIHDQQTLRRRRRGQQRTTLTLQPEMIDRFMPKMSYTEIYLQKEFKEKLKKLQERVIDESCAVCLIEFNSVDQCRPTPCAHVFHSICLEEWLRKHENCPICRQELNSKELEGKSPDEEALGRQQNDISPLNERSRSHQLILYTVIQRSQDQTAERQIIRPIEPHNYISDLEQQQ